MTDDVGSYAAAVRAALGELSAEESADLLEDLESHLAEVAAESDAPLRERLGPPEAYAAELRAAYRPTPPGPPRRLPRVRVSRRWRIAYIAVVIAALVTGIVVWQLQARSAPAEPWSNAQLVDRAQAGEVRQVDVTGSQVVATDRAGHQHEVIGASTDASLAATMTKDDVDVSYRSTGVGVHWVWVLVPSLLMLALIGALGTLLYVALRRVRRGPSRA